MHGRSAFSAIRAGWLAAALVLLQLTAHAGTLTKDTTGFATTYTTNVFKAHDATGLPSVPFTNTLVAPPGQTLGNITYTASGNEAAAMTRAQMPIPNSGGRSVPVDMTAKIPKSSAAAALGRFAAKVYTPLAVGVALLDLASDLGFTMTRHTDGSPGVDLKTNTSTKKWNWSGTGGGSCSTTPTNWDGDTPDLPIGAWLALNQSCQAGITYSLQSCTINPTVATQATCSYSRLFTWNGSVSYFSVVIQATVQQAQTPATIQDLEDKIAAQSGWPTSASRALADAVKSGETVSHDEPTVSGPAHVDGPVTTSNEPTSKTTTNPDGSTTTTSGTKSSTTTKGYTINYNANAVSLTTTTNTTNNYTYNDGTHSTDSSDSSEGTEAPDKPEDPCSAQPDRLGCMKSGDPGNPDPMSKTSKGITVSPASFAGGSCPPPVAFSAFGRSYAFEYTPLCTRLASLSSLFAAMAALVAAWILADSFKVT